MPELTPTLQAFFNARSPELLQVITGADLPGLGSGPRVDVVAAAVVKEEKGQSWPDGVLAGLWLLAGDLDRSHSYSQQDSSAEGSFWHGIMHRREGDYSNAAYWFRRVGRHAVLDQLAEQFPDAYGTPDQFIEAVESRRDAERLKEIQWAEWQSLMAWCCPQDSP